MENQPSDLFIFRTNITQDPDFSRVKNGLEKVPGVHFCTIDLQDCDKVLRVECVNVSIKKIVEEMTE